MDLDPLGDQEAAVRTHLHARPSAPRFRM
jgi:hypothetical protein